MPMPDPVVNPDDVKRVEEKYREMYFTPVEKVEAELATLRPPTEESGKLQRRHDLKTSG